MYYINNYKYKDIFRSENFAIFSGYSNILLNHIQQKHITILQIHITELILSTNNVMQERDLTLLSGKLLFFFIFCWWTGSQDRLKTTKCIM